MPRRPLRSVPTLILHGKGGPGPDHWYCWLADELRAADRLVAFPTLPNADLPVLTDWLTVLDAELAGLPDTGFDVVTHSAGSLLWLHHTARDVALPRPARVALTALPDPAHIVTPTLQHVPLDADAVRRAAEGTVLVGGDDDPNCTGGVAQVWGAPLKIATTMLPGAGHLNPASGYGPWPAMLDWCRRDNLAFY